MFFKSVRVQGVAVIATLLVSASAWGQVQAVQQTLDSVKVHSDTAVLNMNFDDPLRTVDFTDSGINGTNYRACKLTAISGLYCLDGSTVFTTPNIADPGSKTVAIDCNEPALDLDTKKGTPCTAMTVDLTGNVWLATKTKGKAHGLVKATPNMGGSCPTDYTALTAGDPYCAIEMATGRPLLVDISSIDGDFGAEFVHGPGILGLEQRKELVFFPATGGAPFTISDGKGWGLSGKEQLTSATAILVRDTDGAPFSYVLVTTTNGRVLARLADGTGDETEVFDIASNRGPATQCNFDDVHYGIRSSSKSGTIYLADREYCITSALNANVDGSGNLLSLMVATENLNDPLILSTNIGGGQHAPIAPTVAPGINIDLDDCDVNCALIVSNQGQAIAELNNVNVVSAASGLTLFQVKNIPDCRYDPAACVALLGVTNLVAANVIRDPDSGNPAAQLLNMTKLLPMEVTELFNMSGGLPDLWLPGHYRGQNGRFEAFFGVTEDGVIFRDTFEGVFNVAALAGNERGCHTGLPDESPLYTTVIDGETHIGTLEWDVIGTVSERVPTFTDPDLGAGPQYVATISNSGCSSSKSTGVRWSIKPYNLEITPCTYNGDASDVWDSDGACPLGGTETPDDAVFAKLLLTLFDDFRLALDQLACVDADGAGAAPISMSACSTLQASWDNAKDKLDKCWSATQQPKQSSGAQNCTSFVSQLNGLRSALDAIVAPAPPLDPENRIGELVARLIVITHVHDERFVPSIPAGGYDEPPVVP